MKIKYSLLCLGLVSGLMLSGCNTFGGMGKDLAQAGEALETSADWSQQKINEADRSVR